MEMGSGAGCLLHRETGRPPVASSIPRYFIGHAPPLAPGCDIPRRFNLGRQTKTWQGVGNTIQSQSSAASESVPDCLAGAWPVRQQISSILQVMSRHAMSSPYPTLPCPAPESHRSCPLVLKYDRPAKTRAREESTGHTHHKQQHHK